MKKTPIEVFGEWVSMGKDEGMEKTMKNRLRIWFHLQQKI